MTGFTPSFIWWAWHSQYKSPGSSCSQGLSQAIFPLRLHNKSLAYGEEALAMWCSISPVTSPSSGPASSQQRIWDRLLVTAHFEALVQRAPDSISKARLLAVVTNESGVWLNAPPPCILLGIRMDDDTITISASIRLGLAFCLHHPCSQCGAHIDELALPGLSCRKSPGCHSRHNAKNDIHRTLAAAGVPCQMESHGLSRDDGKRPDGVTLLHWKGSTP